MARDGNGPFLPVILIAAALQTVRFSLQKQLKSLGLLALAATAARFVTAAPQALLLAGALMVWRGNGWPVLAPGFWPAARVGGAAQIAGTFRTVALASQRSPAFWADVTGMMASVCWFRAFALMNAAEVRAVGKVELLLALVVSIIGIVLVG